RSGWSRRAAALRVLLLLVRHRIDVVDPSGAYLCESTDRGGPTSLRGLRGLRGWVPVRCRDGRPDAGGRGRREHRLVLLRGLRGVAGMPVARVRSTRRLAVGPPWNPEVPPVMDRSPQVPALPAGRDVSLVVSLSS